MFQKHGLLLVYDAGLMSQHPAAIPRLLLRFPLYSVLRVYEFLCKERLESAETWREAWGFPYAPLAQLVEHLTLNQGVPGSSP